MRGHSNSDVLPMGQGENFAGCDVAKLAGLQDGSFWEGYR